MAEGQQENRVYHSMTEVCAAYPGSINYETIEPEELADILVTRHLRMIQDALHSGLAKSESKTHR